MSGPVVESTLVNTPWNWRSQPVDDDGEDNNSGAEMRAVLANKSLHDLKVLSSPLRPPTASASGSPAAQDGAQQAPTVSQISLKEPKDAPCWVSPLASVLQAGLEQRAKHSRRLQHAQSISGLQECLKGRRMGTPDAHELADRASVPGDASDAHDTGEHGPEAGGAHAAAVARVATAAEAEAVLEADLLALMDPEAPAYTYTEVEVGDEEGRGLDRGGLAIHRHEDLCEPATSSLISVMSSNAPSSPQAEAHKHSEHLQLDTDHIAQRNLTPHTGGNDAEDAGEGEHTRNSPAQSPSPARIKSPRSPWLSPQEKRELQEQLAQLEMRGPSKPSTPTPTDPRTHSKSRRPQQPREHSHAPAAARGEAEGAASSPRSSQAEALRRPRAVPYRSPSRTSSPSGVSRAPSQLSSRASTSSSTHTGLGAKASYRSRAHTRISPSLWRFLTVSHLPPSPSSPPPPSLNQSAPLYM